MEIVKFEDISGKLMSMGYSDEEAKEYAGTVMDYFGFEDRIIDNIVETKDRKIFYELQKGGILETEREETTVNKGKLWRTHYWRLKKSSILDSGKIPEVSFAKNPEIRGEDIYSGLPDHAWLKKDANFGETPGFATD